MGGECWLGSKYQSSRTGCSIFPAVRPCTGYLASLYYSVLICIMGMFMRIKQLHITCLEACLAYSASPINVSQQQPWQNQAETLLTTGRSQLITVQPPTKAPQGPPLAFWAPILSRPAAHAMHGHRERPGERRLRERERDNGGNRKHAIASPQKAECQPTAQDLDSSALSYHQMFVGLENVTTSLQLFSFICIFDIIIITWSVCIRFYHLGFTRALESSRYGLNPSSAIYSLCNLGNFA